MKEWNNNTKSDFFGVREDDGEWSADMDGCGTMSSYTFNGRVTGYFGIHWNDSCETVENPSICKYDPKYAVV